MSFEDCLTEARKEASVPKDVATKAERLWNEKRTAYRDSGDPWHIADARAEQDAKDFLLQYSALHRHVKLTQMQWAANQVQAISELSDDAIRNYQTRQQTLTDMKIRHLKRRFDWKMQEYLDANYQHWTGKNTDKATLDDIVRERHGQDSGNPRAKALAEAMDVAFEDMRLMFNEAGGMIGKLDDFGIPHIHNQRQIMYAGMEPVAKEMGISVPGLKARMWAPGKKSAALRQRVFDASFERWSNDIVGDLDWARITDFDTNRPFQTDPNRPPSPERQQAFLKDVFENIVYGREAKNPEYGQMMGEALYKRHSQQRVLHFKSGDTWLNYNKRYGTGDAHASIVSHVARMADDIVAMRDYSPNPELGTDHISMMLKAEAKKRGMNPDDLNWDAVHAKRMFRVTRGAQQPVGYRTAMSAHFNSTARKVMTGSFLERAMIAALSDTAFSRGAARSIGGNPNNVLSGQIEMIADMVKSGDITTTHMKNFMWVADTQSYGGSVLARFDSEVPAAQWADNYASGVLRVTGLAGWTDAGRFNLARAWAGELGVEMGKKFDDIRPEILKRLKEVGITESDWIEFSRPEFAYSPREGTAFLHAIYWRDATDLPAKKADDIFLKFGAAAEQFLEEGVPTQNLFLKAFIDPVGRDLTPGGPAFELMKSAGMFKSFPLAVTANQYNVLRRMPTTEARMAYAAKTIFEATVTGAVSLQMIEIMKGNDPMPMDNPDFWGYALAKGGGLAILADIVMAGETSWGGGFASYLGGPGVQLAEDTWKLTISNMIEVGAAVMSGEEIDTNFAQELRKYTGRYLMPKDLPVLGPAVDRMILDQAQLFFDPESIDALNRAATVHENRHGNQSWWMPGSPTPDRAPSLDPATFFSR